MAAQCISTSADEPLVSFSSLNPHTALVAAQPALDACRKSDFLVAISVVDRMNIAQVLLRDH